MTINDFPLPLSAELRHVSSVVTCKVLAGVITAGSIISRSMSCGQALQRDRGRVKSRSLWTGLSPFLIRCLLIPQSSRERD